MEHNKLCGSTLIANKKTVCKGFIHESALYPRKGYRKENEPDYTLFENEEVVLLERWSNFYGEYYKVKKSNGKELDIDVSDLTFKNLNMGFTRTEDDMLLCGTCGQKIHRGIISISDHWCSCEGKGFYEALMKLADDGGKITQADVDKLRDTHLNH